MAFTIASPLLDISFACHLRSLLEGKEMKSFRNCCFLFLGLAIKERKGRSLEMVIRRSNVLKARTSAYNSHCAHMYQSVTTLFNAHLGILLRCLCHQPGTSYGAKRTEGIQNSQVRVH